MTTTSDSRTQMNFRIDPVAHDLLRKLADHEAIPIQDLMRNIVGFHLACNADILKAINESEAVMYETEISERTKYISSLSEHD
jgi:antitoxin component of RelBE/YafQ-DinJ toxin-antitoxin module